MIGPGLGRSRRGAALAGAGDPSGEPMIPEDRVSIPSEITVTFEFTILINLLNDPMPHCRVLNRVVCSCRVGRSGLTRGLISHHTRGGGLFRCAEHAEARKTCLFGTDRFLWLGAEPGSVRIRRLEGSPQPRYDWSSPEVTLMDATRARRTRDRARQRWYASQRQRRFARFLGFAAEAEPIRTRASALIRIG
jgi:hypothetical protein